MKNPLALLGLLLALGAGATIARAQDIFTVKTNIAAPISLYAEYGLTQKISVQVGVAYDVFELAGGGFGSSASQLGNRTGTYAVTVPLEFRFFMERSLPSPLQGLYIGPFVKYKTLAYTLTSDGAAGFFGTPTPPFIRRYSHTHVMVGATVGYQGQLGRATVVDIGLGGGANLYNDVTYVQDGVTREASVFSRLPLRVLLSVGYRFENAYVARNPLPQPGQPAPPPLPRKPRKPAHLR